MTNRELLNIALGLTAYDLLNKVIPEPCACCGESTSAQVKVKEIGWCCFECGENLNKVKQYLEN